MYFAHSLLLRLEAGIVLTQGKSKNTRAEAFSLALVFFEGGRDHRGLHKEFAKHGIIDHGKEYVRGIIHTNFAESYFSLQKRGIIGTFHHVSTEHLPPYLSEFDFRWNLRCLSDGERTIAAIRGTEGRRLKYAD